MYEIGKVYIWQNMRQFSELNGLETVVVGPVQSVYVAGMLKIYQRTDLILDDGRVMCAEPGNLRPKNPPSGEQLINEMFYVNVTA